MREEILLDALAAMKRCRTDADATPVVRAVLEAMTDAEQDALAEALAGLAGRWPRSRRLLAMVRGERRLASMATEGGVQ